MLEVIEELIRSVIAHGECVSLFVIVLVVLWILHMQNSRKLDDLRREIENGK